MNSSKFLKNLPLGLIELDMKGSVLHVNDLMKEWLEPYIKRDITGTSIYDYFKIQGTVKEGAHEWSFIDELSKAKRLSVNVSVQLSEQETIVVFCQGIKVTDSENKYISDEEVRLQAIINTAVDGIITINRQGIILSANPASAILFGYSASEMIGKNVKMLMPNPDHTNHDQYLKNYQDSGKRKIIGMGRQVVGLRKTGSTFPIHLSISEVKLSDQIIYTGILHDLSAQKSAENKVRKYAEVLEKTLTKISDEEARLQAIINTAVDGIITLDEMGVILTANSAAANIFDYDAEAIIGEDVGLLIPDSSMSEEENEENSFSVKDIINYVGKGREVLARKRDGKTFPIYLGISQVQLTDSYIYTAILHDLSAQKEAEEKVRRYAMELERSNLELQDFAYVSSHDLQEPLRKIRAFGDRLFSREADNLSEKGFDYLKRMVSAAERMQNLISDLLQFSRVSTHAKEFESINLNEILEEVLEDLELAIEESAATIHIDELPIIEAEPTQMRQLFQNLIANALKFQKPDQKPVITISSKMLERSSFDPTSISGEEIVEIVVKDNGIGFDEQYKSKIFQIFQRLEGRKFKGSGIGLAICKRIATRHGGDIEASSAPGEGATFTITLALQQKS